MMADVVRYLTMFLLGASLMLEFSVLRYTAAVAHFPSGLTILIRKSTIMTRALSRACGVFFIAAELHHRLGSPSTWRTPLALAIAVLSLYASFRTLADREYQIEPPAHKRAK